MLLAWTGKRVTYDQSISSFFADDDPDMAVYQKAAATFGDDNFAFVVYEDPDLLTPAGMDRVGELAAALGPDHVPGRRTRRIDRYDASALGDRRRPAHARSTARLRPQSRHERRQAHRQEHRSEIKRDDCCAAQCALLRTPAQITALKDRLVRHPLFLGTLIDKAGSATAVVARLKKTNQHNVIETTAAPEADLG